MQKEKRESGELQDNLGGLMYVTGVLKGERQEEHFRGYNGQSVSKM